MVTIAKIRVLVAGACGRMGQEVVRAVMKEEDLQLVGAVDTRRIGEDIGVITGLGSTGIEVVGDLETAIRTLEPHVMVDFTVPAAVMGNARLAMRHRVRPVIGTTGLGEKDLAELESLCREAGVGCLVAPNFAVGAVLMMHFAKIAARYMPHVEIIELHHDQKLDAPSGTALKTLALIKEVRAAMAQGHPGEEEKIPGCRGGLFDGMRVHSVRLPGLVAHQEVIFGGEGQTLTIRHDSISRTSFMPGVVLAIRRIMERDELIYGLEKLLDL